MNKLITFFAKIILCALALLASLATASPTFAASFTAEIDGKRITIEQPWYLYTHGETGHKPERLFFTLMDVADDGPGDIKGEGVVYEYPAIQGDVLPAPERIKNMDAARLRELAREFDRKYTRFDSAGTVALAERNGFTAIARERQDTAATEPFRFTYYFPLRDRLVVLDAYVHGTAADAAILEGICASFIPDTSSAQELNTVSGGGVTLRFPHTWSVAMSGFTGPKDSVWATLEMYPGEDEAQVAKITVLGPTTSTLHSDMERYLAYPERAEQLAFHAVGSRIFLQNVKELRDEVVTVAPRLLARRQVGRGEANGKEVELTFQQIPKGDKMLTLISGAVLPLADETRREIETIYASLKIEDDGPEITERLDMSFFELLRYLKTNRPVTSQAVMGLGLTGLNVKTFSNGGDYKANGILLRDGTVIKKLELREHKDGALFILQFGEHDITREALEAELGKLRLYDGPRGRSINERITYLNDSTEDFIVMIGVDQTTRELRGLSVRNRCGGK